MLLRPGKDVREREDSTVPLDHCDPTPRDATNSSLVEWMAASGSGVPFAAIVAVLNVGSLGTRCVK